MPKVLINPSKKGIRQARGFGVHHLDENDKGFMTQVESDTVTLSLQGIAATNSTATTGIRIPQNAWIQKVALKLGTAPTTVATTTVEIDGWTVSGQTFELDTTPGVRPELVADEGLIFSYVTPTENAANALAALDANLTSASETVLVLNFTTGGTADATDTDGSVEIIVEYCMPRF